MGVLKSEIASFDFNFAKYIKSQAKDKSKKFVTVTKELIYIDDKGKEWVVPAGFRSDAISSRKATQWISGEPLQGSTLMAALFHDVYCETQERTQQEVHNVFGEILSLFNVPKYKIKLMVMAVKIYNRSKNPKWV